MPPYTPDPNYMGGYSASLYAPSWLNSLSQAMGQVSQGFQLPSVNRGFTPSSFGGLGSSLFNNPYSGGSPSTSLSGAYGQLFTPQMPSFSGNNYQVPQGNPYGGAQLYGVNDYYSPGSMSYARQPIQMPNSDYSNPGGSPWLDSTMMPLQPGQSERDMSPFFMPPSFNNTNIIGASPDIMSQYLTSLNSGSSAPPQDTPTSATPPSTGGNVATPTAPAQPQTPPSAGNTPPSQNPPVGGGYTGRPTEPGGTNLTNPGMPTPPAAPSIPPAPSAPYNPTGPMTGGGSGNPMSQPPQYPTNPYTAPTTPSPVTGLYPGSGGPTGSPASPPASPGPSQSPMTPQSPTTSPGANIGPAMTRPMFPTTGGGRPTTPGGTMNPTGTGMTRPSNPSPGGSGGSFGGGFNPMSPSGGAMIRPWFPQQRPGGGNVASPASTGGQSRPQFNSGPSGQPTAMIRPWFPQNRPGGNQQQPGQTPVLGDGQSVVRPIPAPPGDDDMTQMSDSTTVSGSGSATAPALPASPDDDGKMNDVLGSLQRNLGENSYQAKMNQAPRPRPMSAAPTTQLSQAGGLHQAISSTPEPKWVSHQQKLRNQGKLRPMPFQSGWQYGQVFG